MNHVVVMFPRSLLSLKMKVKTNWTRDVEAFITQANLKLLASEIQNDVKTFFVDCDGSV
jgi:hypothetical protein